MTKVLEGDHGRVKLSSIEAAGRINVICHKDDIEVVNDRSDVLEINPEFTLQIAASFRDGDWEKAKLDEDFKSRLRIVFPDLDIVADPRHLRDYNIAQRHVVGLIVGTNMAINTGRTPFWRLPETYLHPSSQRHLADLMQSYFQGENEDVGDEE